MKQTLVTVIAGIAFLSLASLSPLTAETSSYGATAARASASSWSVPDMLRYAIEDEYLARAEYVAVMARFGEQRPFSNIKVSEDRHIEWITGLYNSRGTAVPVDEASGRVPVPATLAEAYRIGEKAEIDNIAMYEAFLKSPLLAQTGNADIREVFGLLLSASKNHLSSFQRQIKR